MNPYLEEVEPYICLPGGPPWYERTAVDISAYQARWDMCAKYAWAVPSDDALDAIAARGPIVEIGAGNGYWASLLRARGVVVHAYDHAVGGKNSFGHTEFWTDVLKGDESAAAQHPDATLFLCWPPYRDAMALRSLRKYRGDRLIFVGEGESGCTASTGFFQALDRGWVEEAHVRLPQWPGIHDSLTCYRRRTVSRAVVSTAGAIQTHRP